MRTVLFYICEVAIWLCAYSSAICTKAHGKLRRGHSRLADKADDDRTSLVALDAILVGCTLLYVLMCFLHLVRCGFRKVGVAAAVKELDLLNRFTNQGATP